MTLEEYSEWVLSRHPNATLTEAVLGLVSEAGEVAQVKRKHMAALDEKARADMIEELGDTLHYMVRLAGLLGVTLAELADRNVSKQEVRAARARGLRWKSIFDGGGIMTLEEYSEWVKARHPYESTTRAVLGLVSEAGEVAQVRRKCTGALDEASRADMIEELGDTLHYMVRLAGLLGVTLAELADRNVSKLEARDRGQEGR